MFLGPILRIILQIFEDPQSFKITKFVDFGVQKRPDVHKNVLSIKARSPPGKVSILRIFY